MYYYNNELPPQQGWICPKCGRVNAPWLPTCGCVSSQTRATFDTTSLTDRKTEPSSSEKPNNCETCRYGQDKHRYAHICNECGVGINNYEPKTEPTGYNLSPVKDEPQTERGDE